MRKIPEKDIERVWTERIGKFNTDAMLYCKEGWNEDECIVDARGMSDGTLRFLSIIVAMLTNETNQLIVVEEVDNGLHPSRAKILIDMLKELGHERNLDVLITTHNPALLDAAGTSMIPFITVAHRDEKGQSQLTLLEDIKKLPKMISMENIGELATNGKIESALAREEKNLVKLANHWPVLAASGLSIGDATIKDVAEYYTDAGYQVEILTGDHGLKAYEPKPTNNPRRRR